MSEKNISVPAVAAPILNDSGFDWQHLPLLLDYDFANNREWRASGHEWSGTLPMAYRLLPDHIDDLIGMDEP